MTSVSCKAAMQLTRTIETGARDGAFFSLHDSLPDRCAEALQLFYPTGG
jgi:hypothetical protein